MLDGASRYDQKFPERDPGDNDLGIQPFDNKYKNDPNILTNAVLSDSTSFTKIFTDTKTVYD